MKIWYVITAERKVLIRAWPALFHELIKSWLLKWWSNVVEKPFHVTQESSEKKGEYKQEGMQSIQLPFHWNALSSWIFSLMHPREQNVCHIYRDRTGFFIPCISVFLSAPSPRSRIWTFQSSYKMFCVSFSSSFMSAVAHSAISCLSLPQQGTSFPLCPMHFTQQQWTHSTTRIVGNEFTSTENEKHRRSQRLHHLCHFVVLHRGTTANEILCRMKAC